MCRLNEEKTSPFHRSVRWTGNEAQCQITQKTTPGGAGVHRSAAGSPLRRRNIPPDGLKKKTTNKKGGAVNFRHGKMQIKWQTFA